jgi:hypothetical protein
MGIVTRLPQVRRSHNGSSVGVTVVRYRSKSESSVGGPHESRPVGLVLLKEYHSLLWRKHSLFQLSPAHAEIRTGGGQFSRRQVSPLSSNNKFNNWDSRRKPVQILASCDTGARVTAIDAMYRNGCSVYGGSK